MFVPLTPLTFKQRAVDLFGSKTGIVDGDHRFTYREFGERTHRLAHSLISLGLQPADRVAYMAYNSYPLLEGYYGVAEAGGILLPMNIRLSADEITYILNHSGARFLLIDQDFAGVLRTIFARLDCPPVVIWLTGRPEGQSEPLYDELLADSSSDPPPPLDIDENSTVELFYTSGTTGRPKGVMLTHRNLYLHALSTLVCTRATEADIQLHTIPLFHVNGWGTPQALTSVGGTHVMMRKFDPTEALRLIQMEHITRFYAVPTMLTMLLHHPDIAGFDLSSLRLVMTGGAPTPPDMIRRGEKILGCEVVAGYGLSETTPVLTFAEDKSYLRNTSEDERVTRKSSTGLPLIGVNLRVVGSDGQAVSWNGTDVGEIAVRSNFVMKGYWDDPDATSAVVRDGWFYTGDMAVVDAEGYVLIVDRAKDIIISGGENISSVEIERVLYEHPAVLETAVIGIPDEQWGEVPLALVALKPDCSVAEIDIIDFCRSRIATFKIPRRVRFVPSLPKGGTGKILKRELREPYWEGREKRVH